MDGVAYLKPGAFRLEVIQDDGDPWGMLVTAFPKKCGYFRVMSPAASRAFSGTDGPLNGVRVILVDFWSQGPRYQKLMLWVVLGVTAVLAGGAIGRMFYYLFTEH